MDNNLEQPTKEKFCDEGCKRKRRITIFLISALVIIGILYYVYIQLGPGLNSAVLYYMYTDECSNCQAVKQWMADNSFDEELKLLNINITRLNMNNVLSLPYFNKVTKACELPATSVGVPLLYHDGKCFIGRIEVIDHLNRTIGLV